MVILNQEISPPVSHIEMCGKGKGISMKKVKGLVSFVLAIAMMCSMSIVAFAETSSQNDANPEEVLTFEEFSETIEDAFAGRGQVVEVKGVKDGVVLTQDYLDEILADIATAPENSATFELSDTREELISERMVNGYIEKKFNWYKTIIGEGKLGACEVKVTLTVLLFPNGELYDVDDVSSRLSSGLFATDFTQEDYTASIQGNYKKVDVEVEGYVTWEYNNVILTSDHVLTHTFTVIN